MTDRDPIIPVPSFKNAPLWLRAALLLILAEGAVVLAITWVARSQLAGAQALDPTITTISIQAVAQIVDNTVIVSAVGGVLVSLAAIAFVLRLGFNLTQIRRSAVRFAAGDLRHRIEPAGSHELRDLSASLNQMAEQLSGQIALLQQQRTEQETILQSMQAGVIAIDRDATVLSVNRVAQLMLGLAAESRGRRLEELTDEASLLRFAADAVAEPTDLTREFELRSDPALHVRAIAGNLRNAEGEPIGTVIILSDITHVRRLERLRTDFAANASHELRTPITNIKGYIETLLEDETLDTVHAPRFLGIIARNAERLGAIIDDMLALTTLERVQSPDEIVTQPTPVGSLLHAVRAHLEPDAAAKSTRVLIHVDQPLYAEVNARLAEQAVSNLVANAIKYSPDQTTIEVIASTAKLENGRDAVQIAVSDDGPGIPKEHLSRLFERFYRVDKARSREQGGTGLGLAIAKHIALVHDGTIDAQSQPGSGSTFTIRFPSADDPNQTPSLGTDPCRPQDHRTSDSPAPQGTPETDHPDATAADSTPADPTPDKP